MLVALSQFDLVSLCLLHNWVCSLTATLIETPSDELSSSERERRMSKVRFILYIKRERDDDYKLSCCCLLFRAQTLKLFLRTLSFHLSSFVCFCSCMCLFVWKGCCGSGKELLLQALYSTPVTWITADLVSHDQHAVKIFPFQCSFAELAHVFSTERSRNLKPH